MAEYPQVSIESAGAELNRLHGEIEGKMRSTVADAIRAGEILSKIQASIPHGDFIPWIKGNCHFSERAARRYLQLFEYRSKTATLADLQEAYKQVETLEAQSRMSEEKKARVRVESFIKTGKKPEGWRRGTDDKLVEDEKGKKARIDKITADIEREHKDRVKDIPPPIDLDAFDNLLAEQTARTKKRIEFKERIRLSHEGKDDPFVDAIMDYLNGLADDNRRTEACYNIIKVCKGIANQLQRSAK